MLLARPDPRLDLERLDAPAWVGAAAELVAPLGFRLFSGLDLPVAGAHLLAAFRDEPTLRHFDPERLSYYAPAGDGGGVVRTLEAEDVRRLARRGGGLLPVLWGHVHLVDRVPVENRFLTFGGELRIAPAGAGLTVADLRSPAPIVRWGGHSQATDPIAQAVAAFFGRLMVPVDFTPGAARRIGAVRAEVLFRAFLADGVVRGRQARRRGAEPGPVERWVTAAWREARADVAACEEAERLLRDLDLDRDIAATNGPSAEAERPG